MTDLAGAIPVTASRVDAEDDGFATGLSNTICRDGQSTTTARIPFAAGTSSFGGSTSSVSYAQTNDLNTGMYFPATDQWGLVAGGTATLTSTATVVTVPVALNVTGDITVNTDKFTVTASSGNTLAAGTLTVTGAATLSSTLAVTGDVSVNTNKFTVAASSGNTVVAGTLAITGATTAAGITASGAISGATAAGNMVASKAEMETGTATDKLVTPGRTQNHPGVAKAWGQVASNGGLSSGLNVSSITVNGTGDYTANLTTSFSSANFAVIASLDGSTSGRLMSVHVHTKAADSIRFQTFAATANGDTTKVLADIGFNFVAFGDQ